MNLFPDEKSSHCGAASLPTTTAPRADPWVHGPQTETLLPVVAFLSETFCDGASVHARNPRHVVPKSAMRTVSTCFSGALLRPLLFKPLRQALYGGIVGCRERVLRHYDCHGIDPRSLEIPATRKIRSAQAGILTAARTLVSPVRPCRRLARHNFPRLDRSAQGFGLQGDYSIVQTAQTAQSQEV